MTNILDGTKLSDKITIKIKEEVQKMNDKPKLIVISIGNNEASNIYVNMKKKKCEETGIIFENIKLQEEVQDDEVINIIRKLNNDKNVSGILIQLPIPKHLNKNLIINTIEPNKDVDGLTDVNMIHLINKEDGLISCTPKGIITLLNHYKIEISGKRVIIINRSRLIGIPLMHLFLNMDATVTVCHSKTSNLKKITKEADIIVSAVGQKNFITKDMVKKGCTIIDVGVTRENNQIYGDIDFKKCQRKVSYITPNPKGVGPMTVISLLENIIESKKMSE